MTAQFGKITLHGNDWSLFSDAGKEWWKEKPKTLTKWASTQCQWPMTAQFWDKLGKLNRNNHRIGPQHTCVGRYGGPQPERIKTSTQHNAHAPAGVEQNYANEHIKNLTEGFQPCQRLTQKWLKSHGVKINTWYGKEWSKTSPNPWLNDAQVRRKMSAQIVGEDIPWQWLVTLALYPKRMTENEPKSTSKTCQPEK